MLKFIKKQKKSSQKHDNGINFDVVCVRYPMNKN